MIPFPHHQLSLDLEVYADQYEELLAELKEEHDQALEDASEEEAFYEWADREAARLEENEVKPNHIIKLDWPIIRGGDAA
jgi:predicted transcriptional regulator